MRHFFKKVACAAILTSTALSASAAVITSGDLSYDDQTRLITGGGNTYLSWDIGASWNYATTLAMTSDGGLYSDFHIASQTEAYDFFNLASTGSDAIDYSGYQAHHRTTSNFSQHRFGNNYNNYYSYALFLSDENSEAGFIRSSSFLKISDQWTSIATTDIFSGSTYNSMSWLLVKDFDTAAVTEPSTLALLGLGILGLAGTRRKAKA